MYKALIVDDEIYAVMGIKSGVNWNEMQISEVYEAYNMRGAVKVFEQTQIDLLICDIEMPKGTGIDLLEWVNQHSPATETVFLTAHADFSFMKRAIQLDSFDYLLKPIEFKLLQSTLAKALQSVQQERELHSLREQYKPYYELWVKKKTLLTEKFWNDLFTRRIVCTQSNVKSLLDEHSLPLAPDDRVLPIMLSVENWIREFSTKDEEMMEYAIRKAASELILTHESGEVIQTKQGVNIVVLYLNHDNQETSDELYQRCEAYIQSCSTYFNCKISCYIGEATTLFEVHDVCDKLMEMEYNNLHKSNQVYWLHNFRGNNAAPKLPEFATWALLIEQGKREEMEKQLLISFAELRSDHRLGASALEAFYHGFLQMIHYILQKNGLSAHKLLHENLSITNNPLPRSFQELEAWALRLTKVVFNYLHHNDSVIERLKCYIADHLYTVITREQLADFVFLNPAYLSRLFKKEVGESITDYILHERMKIAKELIINSTIPISEIAKTLGYSNFSYFSKMFKKVYQTNPQHYRRLSV
ncbi:hypothetical protein Back11_01360 [Paenibacillus baekrokdamisoli]|uniref:Uncharacterized protein n=1 Tax=Paenibacillus baekrokdamisoli TaxID=1712516 RepID=A0A3G9IYU5_9BACL|nr:response regulator [Paenibacillus baekrokdamisoli]MBB3069237.1 two-component system response regulator YesN [Paenibacillus baekrokdamisoli]BBH18791.1 hypothetical protein Back11_01360 [Paenibacillus baekrokdamisoli]